MCDRIDDERLRETGAQLARSDHRKLRPQHKDGDTYWAPAFRVAYREERRRLGDCDPGQHRFERGTVTAESPPVLVRVRRIGHRIETCRVCGIWQDDRYLPNHEEGDDGEGNQTTGGG